MKLGSLPPAFAISLLLVLAACANLGPVVTASPPGSVLLAVDLGGSSRIPRIVRRTGEGEGYGIVQPVSTDHASMAGMSHAGEKPMVQKSMPLSATGHGPAQSLSRMHSACKGVGLPVVALARAYVMASPIGK